MVSILMGVEGLGDRPGLWLAIRVLGCLCIMNSLINKKFEVNKQNKTYMNNINYTQPHMNKTNCVNNNNGKISKHEIYKFIKLNPIWIDLDDFFKYIKNQPKGFIYKTCYDILKILDSDWNNTMNRNTNYAIRHFKDLYKNLNIKNDIPAINEINKKLKYTNNSGCNRHRLPQAQGEEGKFFNYRHICPRYYRTPSDMSWFYRRPDWICLPKMFDYINDNMLTKKQTEDLLNPIFATMNNDFCFTFVRNDIEFFSLLKEMCDQMDVSEITKLMLEYTLAEPRFTTAKQEYAEKYLPRAQALDDIISFPANANAAAQSITTAMPIIRAAAENVANVAGNLNNIMGFITDIVSTWKQRVSTLLGTISTYTGLLLEYFVKILALAYLLQQPNNQNLSNAVALLTLILPAGLSASILPFAEGLIRVIKGMMGLQAQGDDDDCGFIRSFFSLTLGIAKGMFGDVPRDVFESMNISSRKVKLISDYIRGTTTILDCLVRIFSKILEWFGEGVIKYFGYIPSFLKEETLTPLIDEFMQIKIDRIDQQSSIHSEAARRVVQLYEKLIKFEANMNKKVREARVNHGIKQAPYLRIMIKSLEGTISRIPDHLRTGLAPRRVKPFWIYLYGDPRIGKTAILQPHLVNALSKSMGLVTKYEDYTNYTYLRNCGEDYWEGYDNHPVLWYNDLFQNFADDQKMHQAVMELTNIIDDNVYPLEMAFERKHCVYFNSKLVISNAQNDILNASFIQNKCWSGGKHLFARRNICLRLSVNPAYADPTVGINYTFMKQQMQANPQNCVGYEHCTQHTQQEYDLKLLFPDDMYIMDFTEPMTGAVICSLNYKAGIKYVCDEAKNYMDKQSNFKDKLYDHFAALWAQADDNDQDQVEPVFHDARLANNSEYVEMILSNAIREISEAMPGLINADEVYNRASARLENGTFQYDVQWLGIARNPRDDCTARRDDIARVRLMVEIIGEDYLVAKDVSWWTRFCIKAKSWVYSTWRSVQEFISRHSEQVFGAISSVASLILCGTSMIVSLKIYTRVFKAILALFGPKVVYLKEGEHLIDTFHRQQPILTQSELEIIYNLREEQNKQFKPTTFQNSVSDAQTHEGKTKVPTPQILRVPKPKGTTAQSYDVQNNIVENIINKQMVKFTIKVFNNDGLELESRRFGSGLCLGADIFVAPYHFWYRWFEMKEYWSSHDLQVFLFLNWNEQLSVKLDWESMSLCRLSYNHTEDLAYFRIKNLAQKQHIKKFFISSNDRPVLSTLYIYGKRANSFDLTTMGVTDGEYKTTTYLHESKDDPLYGGKFAKREIVIPVALYYYNCCTTSGDCGTMVLNCDSSMNCKKIMAMHTAGHTGDGYGVGSLIFQEDIQEVFDFFYPDGFCIKPVAMEFDEPNDTLGLKDMGLMVMGRLPRLIVPEYKIDKQPVLMMPRRSKISKSIVHNIMEEDFGKSTVAPAHLRPYEYNGNKISPLKVALSKMVVVSPMPNASDAEKIKQHMFETILNWKSSYKPKILTEDEMINGFGILNAIEMKTSAGYPYVMIDNTNGKLPFFDVVENSPLKYAPNSYLKQCLLYREECAKVGEIPPTFFIDTLKDETRPLDKVHAGKTRLFQISPLDFNLLLRKYFGAFLAHAQECYITGEGAVGINANSEEWTLMIKRMLAIGDQFLNGDGRNFDASCGQATAMHNVEVINMWYKTGVDWEPIHDRIRIVLWATFLNSFHIVRDVVYQALQGNKSGTFVTTWFNNLMGMFAIRWSYIRAGYYLHTFHLAIAPKFFGDDDAIAVNTILAPKLTCQLHKNTLALLGIEYTSASKGQVVDTWYSLDQITFLKRAFVFDGIRYLPQLDITVIYEIARWSESDPENMVDQMNRFNSALLELSNYGRKRYNTLRDTFVEYCILIKQRGILIDCTQLFHFDYCEYIKWGESYKPAQLSIDRARASDVASVVLYESAVSDVQLSNSEDIGSLHSSVLIQAANAQTYEGKSAPPKAQIVRIGKPKAQGDEENESEQDFALYLVMMDYLKQMEPCFKNFERAINRSMRVPTVKWTASQLYYKVKMLISIYDDCKQLFATTDVVAQGEEDPIAKVEATQEMPKGDTVLKTDESVKDVVKEKTTFIANSQTPHQPHINGCAVPRANNSNIHTDMDMYLKRPVILDQFQWKTTDTIYKQLGVWDFPKNFILLPGIAQKLAMVMYSRPDFEFEILLNASKFHYGRLLFCIIPFYQDGTNKIPECYDRAYNATTWPYWYQITAGTGQSIKFNVPYKHIMSQLELHSTLPHDRYMFSIKCYVMAPLQTVADSTGTSAPVEVTIMANMSTPRLFGNVFVNEVVAQGEEISLSSQRVVVHNPEPPMSTRVVSSALEGVSQVTKDLASLAYRAGYSTPTNLGTTNSMQIRQPLMNKISDVPNTVKLGPDLQTHLICSKEMVNSNSEDDMNINEIISSPCLLSTLKFTVGDTIGKTIWSTYLRPDEFTYSGEGFSEPTGAYYPLPVAYLSRYFNLWRGGWKLHFSAICSAFHSARLRIFYIPAGMNFTVPQPSQDLAGLRQTSYLRNIIWDITKSSDITIRVPYECNTHWRYTAKNYMNSIGGYIGLQVVNTLNASTANATPVPIYIQIFASADDDFQFSSYGRRTTQNNNWAPDFAVTLPTAQGEEFGMTPCQLPCSSSTCLREQKGILFGDIDSRTRKFGDAISNTFTSVKQMINMLTPIDYITTTNETIVGRSYTPFGTQSTRGFVDPFWYAPFHTILPLFRFARGSFRFHALTNDKLQCGALMKLSYQDVGTYEGHNYDVMNGVGPTALALSNTLTGYSHFFDNSLYPIDVTVPYYHAQPCMYTCNGRPVALAQQMVPTLYIGISTGGVSRNMIFCVAAGDDFMLGYRMAIPRVRELAPALASTQQIVEIERPPPIAPNETEEQEKTKTKQENQEHVDEKDSKDTITITTPHGSKVHHYKRGFIERLLQNPNREDSDSSD